jgi:hypothetical protein
MENKEFFENVKHYEMREWLAEYPEENGTTTF